MLISFFGHGKGSGAAAVKYLTGDRDHAGELRAAVITLRGDPGMVAAVADELDTEWKYTSGLIAWSPADNPTPEQIEKTIDSFEELAFAGLAPDQYSWSAILHADRGGRKHIHIFAARCELTTGKSLNIAPPGWQKTYDLLRDSLNIEHGWSRPDDLQRQKERTLDAAEFWSDHPNKNKEAVHSWIMERVEAGAVENRGELVETLQEIGEVTRQGKDYVSLKLEGQDKAIRLRGGIYREKFDREALRQAGAGIENDPRVLATELEKIRKRLKGRIEDRIQYNQKRYCRPSSEFQQAIPGLEPVHRTAAEVDQTYVDPSRDHNCNDLAGYLSQQLGCYSVLDGERESAVRSEACSSEPTPGINIPDLPTWNPGNESRWRTRCREIAATIEGVYDRVRAEVVERLRSFEQRFFRADQHLVATVIETAETDHSLDKTKRAIERSGDAVERACGTGHGLGYYHEQTLGAVDKIIAQQRKQGRDKMAVDGSEYLN